MKKKLPFILAPLVLFALGLLFFRHRHSSAPPYIDLGHGDCPGPTQKFEVTDGYLRGILEKGTRVPAVMNWYSCHVPQRGELALLRFSNQSPPVVRIVRGVPGDRFRLTPDKKMKAWNLEINGELIKAGNRPYFFGATTPPTLSLYEKSHHGILKPGEAIVFSSQPPGESDSGTLGIVSLSDLVGRVEGKPTVQ